MDSDAKLHLGEMLVEKISNAVGELYDPYGIKKARKDFVGKVLDRCQQGQHFITL